MIKTNKEKEIAFFLLKEVARDFADAIEYAHSQMEDDEPVDNEDYYIKLYNKLLVITECLKLPRIENLIGKEQNKFLKELENVEDYE